MEILVIRFVTIAVCHYVDTWTLYIQEIILCKAGHHISHLFEIIGFIADNNIIVEKSLLSRLTELVDLGTPNWNLLSRMRTPRTLLFSKMEQVK